MMVEGSGMVSFGRAYVRAIDDIRFAMDVRKDLQKTRSRKEHHAHYTPSPRRALSLEHCQTRTAKNKNLRPFVSFHLPPIFAIDANRGGYNYKFLTELYGYIHHTNPQEEPVLFTVNQRGRSVVRIAVGIKKSIGQD